MKYSLGICLLLLLLAGLWPAGLDAQQQFPKIFQATTATESQSASQPPGFRPLRPPAADSEGQNPAAVTSSITQSVIRVAASLAVVLALFFLLIWLLRRVLPRQSAQLPRQAFDLLGNATLSPRHTVQLLQFGNKLLLVSLTTGDASTLAEITDPAEVERLLTICQSPSTSSPSSRQQLRAETDDFQQMLDQIQDNAVISSVRS